MSSHFDLLVLSRVPGIGEGRLRALVAHFGTPSAVMRAGARELACVEGITRAVSSRTVQFLRGGEGLEAARAYAGDQLVRARRAGAELLAPWDGGYPAPLLTIYDPPPILFAAGSYLPADAPAVAIVGTRKPTPYGRDRRRVGGKI